MKRLLGLITLLIVLGGSCLAQHRGFCWSGIIPGQTTRAEIEKRFGTPRVRPKGVVDFNRVTYDAKQIARGGQDAVLPATQIGISYRDDKVTAITIAPEQVDAPDREYFTDGWLIENIGRPNAWVVSSSGTRTLAIYFDLHITAILEGSYAINRIREITVHE